MEKLYFFSALGSMTITAALLWRWFISPWARSLQPVAGLQVLLVVHCFRFISPISLMPGVTMPGLSTEFTYPQVLGDMATTAFALVAIAALRQRARWAIGWVWFTNCFGLLDLAVVTVQGLRFQFAEHVGAMFYVIAWFVPWLMVSHLLLFKALRERS
ncbi:hypothetical protein [Devosia sp.]|uniref:hypothetical protein n=1 Tax=Devosia sp. TaxID=1871048 RepID=UPI0032650B88